MLISELLEKLSSAKEEYGDIEVVVYNMYSDPEPFAPVQELIFHKEEIYWHEGDVMGGPEFRYRDNPRLELSDS